jgi:hypothetical protein
MRRRPTFNTVHAVIMPGRIAMCFMHLLEGKEDLPRQKMLLNTSTSFHRQIPVVKTYPFHRKSVITTV